MISTQKAISLNTPKYEAKSEKRLKDLERTLEKHFNAHNK